MHLQTAWPPPHDTPRLAASHLQPVPTPRTLLPPALAPLVICAGAAAAAADAAAAAAAAGAAPALSPLPVPVPVLLVARFLFLRGGPPAVPLLFLLLLPVSVPLALPLRLAVPVLAALPLARAVAGAVAGAFARALARARPLSLPRPLARPLARALRVLPLAVVAGAVPPVAVSPFPSPPLVIPGIPTPLARVLLSAPLTVFPVALPLPLPTVLQGGRARSVPTQCALALRGLLGDAWQTACRGVRYCPPLPFNRALERLRAGRR